MTNNREPKYDKLQFKEALPLHSLVTAPRQSLVGRLPADAEHRGQEPFDPRADRPAEFQ